MRRDTRRRVREAFPRDCACFVPFLDSVHTFLLSNLRRNTFPPQIDRDDRDKGQCAQPKPDAILDFLRRASVPIMFGGKDNRCGWIVGCD